MIRLASLLVLWLALISSAQASKLYIREYRTISTIGPTIAQIAPEPGADQAPVDFTGGTASSAAFAATTRVVRVWCDVSCSVLFGAAPTASNVNAPLGAGTPEYFAVIPGQLVSVHSFP